MSDQKIQLIIEAYDKTKDAFASLDKAVKGLDASTRQASSSGVFSLAKLKESWMGLSAAAIAAWMTIQKAMNYVELGARAMQAETAYAKTAESMDVNADRMLASMKKASAGTIDESHLMQKALKGMAQDVDPNKIPQLFEAARVGAVKAGEDVTNVADSIIDAIANQMPKSLKRFGLVSKEELSAFNKAVSAGAEDLNLLDIVLNRAKIQAAKMGLESYNAAIAVQRFKAEVEELKETLGKGIITGLEKLWNVLKAAASGALLLAAGLRAVQAGKLEYAAKEKEEFYNKYAAKATPEARNKMLADWQNSQYLADQAWLKQEELAKSARSMQKSSLNALGIYRSGDAGDDGKDETTQAKLDADAAKAKADNEKILADWKKMGASKSFIEGLRALMQADIQGIKSGLDTAREGYKLQDAAAEEHYKSGLDAESAYIAAKQRLEKAGLMDTLSALEKEKTATQARYQAMIGGVLPGQSQDEERNKLAAEQKKEVARIDGEIAKTRIDLQIADKKNDIDAIERKQKLADITREGVLSLLQEEVKLRTQLNSLQVERGGMTESAATAAEIAGNRSILELQKQQIEEKIVAGGLADDEDANLKNQLTLIDTQLTGWKVVTAEKLKQQNADEKTLEIDRERLVNTYKLREELAKSAGDYQAMYDMQKRSLEIERARALLKVSKTVGFTQEDIDAVNQYYDNLERRIVAMKTPLGALALGLKDFAVEAANVGQKLYDSIKKAFDGMTDALTEFVMTGKLNFTDLANSIIRDMIRIMIQQSITGPLARAAGNVDWGSLFNQSASGSYYDPALGMSVKGTQAPVHHSGGMGNEPTSYRLVPNPDMLPRYHKGLGPGERYAITTDDESTMTPGQRKDFFKLASQIGGGSPQAVTVKIVNEDGGNPVKVSDSRVSFNAQEMVVTVWLDALRRNSYGLRDAMGG